MSYAKKKQQEADAKKTLTFAEELEHYLPQVQKQASANRNSWANKTEQNALRQRKSSQQVSCGTPSLLDEDKEQEDLITKNVVSITHLTNSQIVNRLEEQRLLRLHKAGANLKCEIMLGQRETREGVTRCPKCTLPMPCQHFESDEDLFCFKKSGRIFKQNEWNMIKADNREQLIKKKLVMERKRQLSADVPLNVNINTHTGSNSLMSDRIGSRSNTQQHKYQAETIGWNDQNEAGSSPELNENAAIGFNTIDNNCNSQPLMELQHGARSAKNIDLQSNQMKYLGPGRCFKAKEKLHQATLVRKLRDDSFLRRLQLHTLKNQAASINHKGPGQPMLSAKDRQLLEKQIVEQKMEQIVNTDRFSDLIGLDEQQLKSMLKQERVAESRTAKGNYQPWEGMNRTHRKEFIERLLIQHKRRQLEEAQCLSPGDSILDFTTSDVRPNTSGSSNILARRKRNQAKSSVFSADRGSRAAKF